MMVAFGSRIVEIASIDGQELRSTEPKVGSSNLSGRVKSPANPDFSCLKAGGKF
jgi:hypothetical protein